MDDEELFEIVDYTSASPWEKCTAAIESQLTMWGLEHGSLGVLDPVSLSPKEEQNFFPLRSKVVSRPQIKKDFIQLGDQQFVLSYQFLPTLSSSIWERKDIDNISSQYGDGEIFPSRSNVSNRLYDAKSDFIPIIDFESLSVFESDESTSPPKSNQFVYGLHRWTGQTHILILSPISNTDIINETEINQNATGSSSPWLGKTHIQQQRSKSSGAIDISTSKLLMSSFSIALHNTGCALPAFVSIGSAWRCLYTGILLSPKCYPEGILIDSKCSKYKSLPLDTSKQYHQSQSSNNFDFNHILLRYGLESYSLETHFKMIHMPFIPIDQSHVAGLLSFFIQRYRLCTGVEHVSELTDKTIANGTYVSAAFTYSFKIPDVMKFQDHRLGYSISNIPNTHWGPELPLGPRSDPIMSLNLECFFPPLQSPLINDNEIQSDLDPNKSSIWYLYVQFNSNILKGGDHTSAPLYCILKKLWTVLIEVPEINSSAPESVHQNREKNNPNLSELGRAANETSNDSITISKPDDTNHKHHTHALKLSKQVMASALFGAVGAATENTDHSLPFQSTGFVDADDMDQLMKDVFDPIQNKTSHLLLTSAITSLIHQTQLSVTVPQYSLLWKLAHRLMDIASPSSAFRFNATLQAFVRALWRDVLNEFKKLVDSGSTIPDISIALDSNLIGIDLKYSILHQKLCMLNCCLHKQGGNSNEIKSEKSSIVLPLNEMEASTEGNHYRSSTSSPPTLHHKKTVTELGSRFFSTITDIATDAIIKPVLLTTTSSSTNSQAPASIHRNVLVDLFDKLTSEEDPVKETTQKTILDSDQNVSNAAESTSTFPNPQPSALSASLTSANNANSAISGINIPRPIHRAMLSGSVNSHQTQLQSHQQHQRHSVGASGAEFGTSWSSDRSWEDFSGSGGVGGVGASDKDGRRGDVQLAGPDMTGEKFKDMGLTTDDEEVDGDDSGSLYGDKEKRRSSQKDHDVLFFDSMEEGVDEKICNEVGETRPRAVPIPMSRASGSLKNSTKRSILEESSGGLIASVGGGGDMATSFDSRSSLSMMGESFVQLSHDFSQSVSVSPPISSASAMKRAVKGHHILPQPEEVGSINESEGALRVMDPHAIILATGNPIMIPRVQEPGFMTEDMIREQESIFENLGTSADAARMRAKMQSAQLKSDMESFKAANPHASLEDFIRWHSPRDWIPDVESPSGGRLSSRMLEADNLWIELWKTAKRIPASRQKPIFDVKKEIDNVFKYLENLTPVKLIHSLFPTFLLISYDILVKHPIASKIPSISKELKILSLNISIIPWNETDIHESAHSVILQDVLQSFRSLELKIGIAVYLLQKLPMQYLLVDRLISFGLSKVKSGVEQETVYDLFLDEYGKLKYPTSREFVFKTMESQNCDKYQQMYALLKDGEFRIVFRNTEYK